MVNMIRLMAIAAALLTVVYFSLLAYFRAATREQLETTWETSGRTEPREDYIKAGLKKRLPVIKRRLVIWVYAVPLSLIALLVYTPTE
jgi:hypothetical protein